MSLSRTGRDDQRGRATDTAACLARALDYAARGWHVLQVHPRSKNPVAEAWQQLATTDPAVVEGWWPAGARWNVGVQLGPRSGIIDVECDSPEAEQALAGLLTDDYPVVPTFRGKRGDHRLFVWAADLPCPDKAVFKFRGVEFRTGNGGKGAQSVFPPSVHPDGGVYTWLVDPDAADPVPFPPAALAALRRELGEGGRGPAARGDSGRIAAGGRNAALASLAGTMRRRGMSREAIAAALLVVNAQQCDPPLPEDEVREVARKVSRYGPAAPARDGPPGTALGRFTLTPGRARQSASGKYTVTLTVTEGGRAVDALTVTSSATGRAEAARSLRKLAGDLTAEEVDAALRAVFAGAAARADEPPAGPGGGPLREAVRAYVAEHFRPRNRVGKRVWLDGLGEAFDRASFLHLVSTALLGACREAAGVPPAADEYAVLACVEDEMRVVFADLLTTLPVEESDGKPMHRDKRRALAAAVLKMWRWPRCYTRVKVTAGTKTEETTRNVGVVVEARKLAADPDKVPSDHWQRLHPAHPAFIRRHLAHGESGEVEVDEVLLGMNAGLADSTGVRLPEGVNEFNLRKLGKKAGVFRDVPGLTGRAGRGKERVIPLSRVATRRLLDEGAGDQPAVEEQAEDTREG
jgi:hypothetical protein